jgi:hypothetical protein
VTVLAICAVLLAALGVCTATRGTTLQFAAVSK